MSRVLIVDDEPQILRALRINLRARHYEVHTAATAADALAVAAAHPPDLVILDLGLPDMDGTEVIGGLRGWTPVPIIVLSGRADSPDKVAALDAGADDYVTKPFGMAELLARMRAAARRTPVADDPPSVRLGDLTIDLAAKRVIPAGAEATIRSGEIEGAAKTARTPADVRLTPTEWHLLEVLLRNPGKLLSQRQLLRDVWGPGYDKAGGNLRLYMAQLRRKLEPDPARPRWLITEPGMGYRYQPPDEPLYPAFRMCQVTGCSLDVRLAVPARRFRKYKAAPTVASVSNDVVLALVVITALGFDFTNGFHDTANAMATSIATGALPPRIAVAISGVLNFAGAFLSLAVAATIASGLVETKVVTLTVVAAGLAGGIIWNLLTWLLGIPSSSSHALIGGVIGSTMAASGGGAVLWSGLASKVVIPAVLSPVIAALVAATGTWLLYRITRSLTDGARRHGFRAGQVASACMVSLAHGTNDAQKTMGVITLALIANGTLASSSNAPVWVIVCCALAISAGTYAGGWRVIRTLGKGLVEIESPQGMAAESASAAVILLSASFGYSLSTTHVATGSIIGTGLGKAGAEVRWGVAGRMATAWVFTLPAAALAGAGAEALAHAIGGTAGVVVDLVILLAVVGAIYHRSRRDKVDHQNVNDEWTGPAAPAEPAAAAA